MKVGKRDREPERAEQAVTNPNGNSHSPDAQAMDAKMFDAAIVASEHRRVLTKKQRPTAAYLDRWTARKAMDGKPRIIRANALAYG